MVNNSGHRERLFEKYEKAGIDSFHDYEILEMILTFILPRRDTKKISKDLLRQYKTINNILNANSALLSTIDGLREKSINKLKFIRDFCNYCLKEKQLEEPIVSNRTDVENYLRLHFGYRSDEYMAVIFLDNSHHVLGIDECSKGSVNRCNVYPRNVFAEAFNYGAAAIIIAHNHPGGSIEPSPSDWNLTKKMVKAGKILDISLLDHILITSKMTISLREDNKWPIN